MISVTQRLPAAESLTYNLLDSNSHQIGTATVAIQSQGGSQALSQKYTDQQGHIDDATVTVDPTTLLPQSASHTINTTGLNTSLQEMYTGGTVTATVNGNQQHQHVEKVTGSTYDDQESFFLMRVVDFAANNQYHFATVVVDAAKGTISRAVATITVQGTTTITLGGKSLKTWQVVLTGAGASNTAWFEDAPARRLLRYQNSRGTVLELTNP